MESLFNTIMTHRYVMVFHRYVMVFHCYVPRDFANFFENNYFVQYM